MKKTSSVLMGLSLSWLLAGCATESTFSDTDTARVSRNVIVKYDEFKKQTDYTGPTMAYDFSKDGHTDTAQVFLRAFKNNSLGIQYQLYVSSNYDAANPRHYKTVYDSDGKSFDAHSIGLNVDTCYSSSNFCAYEEDFGPVITEAYLNDHIKSGARFKADGPAGEIIFNVSGQYIEGFLNVVKASNAQK